MRRRWLPALGCLLAWHAYGENVKIVVNGREINTSVIESNGVFYVPVDALARALGAAVTIQPGQAPAPIAPAPAASAVGTSPVVEAPLIVAAPTAPPAPAPHKTEPEKPAVTEAPKEAAVPSPTPAPPPPEPAPSTMVVVSTPPQRQFPVQSVKGKLTFKINIFDPHGLDVGAQVWLVPAAQLAGLAAAAGGTADEPIPETSVGWGKKLNEDFKFAHAVADANGEFSFTDVPPGEYTLVLLSKHTNSLAARDRAGKMRFKKIVVRQGETVNASFGFGMSSLPMEDGTTPPPQEHRTN